MAQTQTEVFEETLADLRRGARYDKSTANQRFLFDIVILARILEDCDSAGLKDFAVFARRVMQEHFA